MAEIERRDSGRVAQYVFGQRLDKHVHVLLGTVNKSFANATGDGAHKRLKLTWPAASELPVFFPRTMSRRPAPRDHPDDGLRADIQEAAELFNEPRPPMPR